jgi:elongation factor 1-alpha
MQGISGVRGMMMAGREVRISLLGHKDHGKSTLIGRLLFETKSITQDRINEAMAMSRALGKEELDFAFLLDSFEEEREGGFTLDTTRAQVKHNGTIYELIDVPGHRELVRNMLSGASAAQAAVLIVSAKEDEGLQDETKLHTYIAGLLGIERLVVAVNKMDMLQYSETRYRKLVSDISGTLGAFGFDTAKIGFVPVSAKNGDNVLALSPATPWYKGRPLMGFIEEFARAVHGEQPESRPLRLFVQDVYGPVIVGRVETGSLSAGEEVAFEPLGARAKVKGLFVAGKHVDKAYAGQNVGTELEPAIEVGRGCVCVPEKERGLAVKRIKARLFCLGQELKSGDALHITCASQEAGARIVSIVERINPVLDEAPRQAESRGNAGEEDGDTIRHAEAATVEIELEKPLVFESFSRMPPTGRFILSKGGSVVAAGVVL